MITHQLKINLELVSLRYQKIDKTYDAFIQFFEDRLHYKVEFRAEEPKDKEDESIGTEKVNTCWERIVQRNRVCGLEIEYVQATHENDNLENRWCVSINMMGYSQDLKIWFKEESKARDFSDKIFKWIFPNAEITK